MRQLAYGAPLVLEHVPEPVPGPGEVVVTVTRAAVNPLDVWISRGSVAAAGPLPRTGGGEGAGVTADGRRVAFRGAGLGVTRDGAYAERVAVPAAALADIPDGVSDAQAAGVGIAGVTALDVVELSGITPGSTVLVLGASGGVGSYALQLARARGARTIAQTSDASRVASLTQHADRVVVSVGDDLEEAVNHAGEQAVDVVLDGLGGAFGGPAVRLLRAGGVMVVYGASAGPSFTVTATEFYRKMARVVGYGGLGSNPAELSAKSATLLAEIASGRVAPRIAAELPLVAVNDAHLRIVERRAGGKLLLVP